MLYHCEVPVLETERLRLRGLTRDDFGPLHDMCSDEETMRYLGGPLLPEETSQRHASMIGHWILRGYGMWAVEEKASGDFVGRVGLIDFDGWPQIEVGWLIGRPWWGRGYAPEAARAAAHWGFQRLGLDSIISIIVPVNEKSARVAEKIGEEPAEPARILNYDVILHRASRARFYEVNAQWYQDAG